MHHHSLCNPQTTVQPCLAQKLEEGKKKKKKKITLDFVAAEMASLVASRGSDETPTLHPPPSTPQLEEESQRTGATPDRVTEPGMEEHGYLFCSQAFPSFSIWSLIGSNQKPDDGKACEWGCYLPASIYMYFLNVNRAHACPLNHATRLCNMAICKISNLGGMIILYTT